MAKFEAPIPGQSLTDSPKNSPWENPPQMEDPEEVMMYHIERLNDEERMENLMFLLETGYDIQTMVSGILRAGVVEGIHSVDVSLIVAPILHEFIKGNADALGVEYEEGFEDKEAKKKLEYQRNKLRARKMISKLDGNVEEKEAPMEMPEEAPMEEAPKKGLMSKPKEGMM